ncbi:MAG: hypothetical protein ACYCZ6_16225 [Polaromonas sp.]
MNNLYAAAVALMVAGLSIGVALLWLRRLSRLHRQRMDQLLALREALHEDPLGTLARHQGTLARLGLRSLDWQGHWYGAPVSGSLGEKIPGFTLAASPEPATPAGREGRLNGQVLSQHFQYDDIALELRIGLRGLRGERRLFAMQAAELLLAMLQGALAARQLALVAAVSQRARVGVFLQHDMRNLAQWVQLVADDFAAAKSDDALLASARRLRGNAALAASRAQGIMQALLNPALLAASATASEAQWSELDLAAHIRQAGEMHQVAIDLEGAATLPWDARALATVLDNVLGNVSGLSRERLLPAHCRVVIAEQGQAGSRLVCVRFETPQLPLAIPLEKLFEPWATSGSVNKGLGLYQARKQAQGAGATLYAEPMETGISVTLCLPCKKS